jgi:hypothetical protein
MTDDIKADFKEAYEEYLSVKLELEDFKKTLSGLNIELCGLAAELYPDAPRDVCWDFESIYKTIK